MNVFTYIMRCIGGSAMISLSAAVFVLSSYNEFLNELVAAGVGLTIGIFYVMSNKLHLFTIESYRLLNRSTCNKETYKLSWVDFIIMTVINLVASYVIGFIAGSSCIPIEVKSNVIVRSAITEPMYSQLIGSVACGAILYYGAKSFNRYGVISLLFAACAVVLGSFDFSPFTITLLGMADIANVFAFFIVVISTIGNIVGAIFAAMLAGDYDSPPNTKSLS